VDSRHDATWSLHPVRVSYRRSQPLERWLVERRAAIDTLASAHAAMGEIDGPGRPLEIGRPMYELSC
jgi:hypothetical protein